MIDFFKIPHGYILADMVTLISQKEIEEGKYEITVKKKNGNIFTWIGPKTDQGGELQIVVATNQGKAPKFMTLEDLAKMQ